MNGKLEPKQTVDPADLRLTRRELIGAAALAGAGIAVSACAHTLPTPEAPHSAPPTGGSAMSNAPAFSGKHRPTPLPFKPNALSGLSERLIVSHHENNYGGAVKNLNRVELELSAVHKDTPPLLVAALRERELTFRNSKTLHEAYFANLGGNGRRSGAIETALSATYGASSRWEEHFRLTGMGLGGSSGWVILGHELDTGTLRTFWSGNHTQAPANCIPLLVMDMYEHSYHIDYGAQHAQYIDAFFANANWDEVNRRLERAQRAATALRAS
jgi:Fe-Mn family superoxide dismutase